MVTLDRLDQIKANVAHLHADVKSSFLGRMGADYSGHWQRAASSGCLFGVLHDVEQLHVKDKSGARLNARRRAALTIGELGRTDQATLPANVHVLYSFRPALDNPF